MTDKQIQILMLLHELEKNKGELYLLFAAKFPERSVFWTLISREE